jgi:hypothetical protein
MHLLITLQCVQFKMIFTIVIPIYLSQVDLIRTRLLAKRDFQYGAGGGLGGMLGVGLVILLNLMFVSLSLPFSVTVRLIGKGREDPEGADG